ncbi:retrovirus-related Pol polyprotein [Elysia marginata]|uniref:Retrovirus-related Pol polyprotein n=1 Tax=Elysia marginata TaxID=1093978 RepID=A0AAV4G7A7_9GAST|nr:retrovirus-related Pol polyprotein [Elysia marginata]
MSTCGPRNVSLRFNETIYDAHLIIADMKNLLLDADFFRRHNLLVDLNCQRLIEAVANLSCPCSNTRVAKTELASIEQVGKKFRKILHYLFSLAFTDFFLSRCQAWCTASRLHHRTIDSLPIS